MGLDNAMTEPGLLAAFAHLDDESFRCGGTLALLARRGVRLRTDGTAG
jgi:LmbE family N-acetylglucosaminyl deacetylase